MRLQVSKRSELAVRVLRVLATPRERRRTAAELASLVDTTANYLPQVVAPLLRVGWIGSEPGPNGGYRLVIDAGSLSLLDVIEAVEGPIDDGRCVLDRSSCSDLDPCDLHRAWSTARSALRDHLASTPLSAAEVADPNHGSAHVRTSTPQGGS